MLGLGSPPDRPKRRLAFGRSWCDWVGPGGFSLPKLLMFAPCEKVIIDQNNNSSVISILQDLQVEVGPTELPQDAAVPMRWDVFTLWLREASDEGRKFEQICELLTPDGKRATGGTISFEMTMSMQRNVMTLMGFPLVPSGGQYLLRLSLKEAGEDRERREVAEFPILLSLGRRR